MYPYKKSHISKIVHIVDIDGAYIGEDKIFKKDIDKISYEEDGLFGRNPKGILKRNKLKSSCMNVLSTTPKISQIDYAAYYMSVNLEHVFHDMRNVPDDEKHGLSDLFAEKFEGREWDFIEFINSPEIAVKEDHLTSWDFIKKDANSLNRHSNFHLFFNKY